MAHQRAEAAGDVVGRPALRFRMPIIALAGLAGWMDAVRCTGTPPGFDAAGSAALGRRP